MKHLLALVAGLACFAVSADTTVSPGVWDLYRGTSKVSTHASEAACIAAADALNVLRGYTCRTRTAVTVTADAPPPPAPTPVPPNSPNDNGATLIWPAVTVDSLGNPASYTYRLAQNFNGGSYATVADNLTATSYGITGLAVGQHCWRVYGKIGALESGPSPEWCKAIALPDPVPPPADGAVLPAADAARIPWHNGAGAWGPRVVLEVPALPRTTRTVNVSTRDQFNQAASVAGTLVNITAGWDGNQNATINANDVDVVIPAGVSIGAIEYGVWPRTTAIARTRIRGDGRMGQYRDHPLVTDVTIDGVDLNGDSGFGGSETNQAFRASGTRIAVLNVRAIAGAYAWLGSARHVVIRNSNLFHGAATVATLGSDPGGWGIRNYGGPITILDSRIQGTRYSNVRLQPTGSADLFYATRTTFVQVAEGGRVGWFWDNLGQNTLNGQGAVIEDGAVYSYGAPGCGYPDFLATNTQFSRVRNMRFFSGGNISWSQAALNGMRKLAGGDHDWTQGNTFAPIASLPAWSGPGDPAQVQLPAGLTLIRGEGSCLSPF